MTSKVARSPIYLLYGVYRRMELILWSPLLAYFAPPVGLDNEVCTLRGNSFLSRAFGFCRLYGVGSMLRSMLVSIPGFKSVPGRLNVARS